MTYEQWALVVLFPAAVIFLALWLAQRAHTQDARAATAAATVHHAERVRMYESALRSASELTATYRLERDAANARADSANDRLLAAWKEGYTVPQSEVEPELADDLPEVLTEWLAQWEDPNVRLRWEHTIRAKLQIGRTPDNILADIEMKMVAGRTNVEDGL